jgi:hypothetical protein
MQSHVPKLFEIQRRMTLRLSTLARVKTNLQQYCQRTLTL